MLISLQDVRDIIDIIALKLKDVAEEAYVFGSIVEGSAIIGESDLDLLIIPGNREVDYFSLLDEVIEKLLDIGIILHIHIADNATYTHLLEHIRGNAVKIV